MGRLNRIARTADRLGVALVVAFIVNLLAAAVFLALNMEDEANELAEIAYYFLVGGVLSQLIAVAGEETHDTNNS